MRARCLQAMAILALLSGCDNGPTTAVQLVLTPDPQIGNKSEVTSRVASLQLAVDGAGGLQGVTEAGPRPDGGTASDWDGDGELEVLFRVERSGDELPVLEVGLDQNADRELTYRVMGFAAPGVTQLDQAVAMGGVSASCPAGEVRQVGTPFNLRSWVRPPRVVLALPGDQTKVMTNLVAFTLMFSTTVVQETLAGNVTLEGPDGAPLDVTPALETLVYPEAQGLEERRSLLELQFTLPGVEGQYTVRVLPGVKSTAGRGFDQDPTTAALDPFVSRFFHGPMSGGGTKCDTCPDGYLCHDTLPGCIPELTCVGGCATGFVCDPSSGQCVEDCRPFGTCVDPAASCDAKTGLCG